jgi:hypothetical protein
MEPEYLRWRDVCKLSSLNRPKSNNGALVEQVEGNSTREPSRDVNQNSPLCMLHAGVVSLGAINPEVDAFPRAERKKKKFQKYSGIRTTWWLKVKMVCIPRALFGEYIAEDD